MKLANTKFSALNDGTRRRMMVIIAMARTFRDPLTQSAIADLTNVTRALASHHLNKLAAAGLLRPVPSSKTVSYRLTAPCSVESDYLRVVAEDDVVILIPLKARSNVR